MHTRQKSWSEQDLHVAVEEARSIRQVLKKIGLKEAGGNYAQIRKYLIKYSIDTSHFTGRGWSKGLTGIGTPLVPLREILVRDSFFQSHKLKLRLYKEKLKFQKCEECGWAERSVDGRLPLELDHINGDSKDNRIENLRILCPNCHSLKPTHRGRNKRRG